MNLFRIYHFEDLFEKIKGNLLYGDTFGTSDDPRNEVTGAAILPGILIVRERCVIIYDDAECRVQLTADDCKTDEVFTLFVDPEEWNECKYALTSVFDI